MKVYTNLNNLYGFLGGQEGFGYSSQHGMDCSELEYWHFEIYVPVERIIVSDSTEKYGERYTIKWKEAIVND